MMELHVFRSCLIHFLYFIFLMSYEEELLFCLLGMTLLFGCHSGENGKLSVSRQQPKCYTTTL